MRQPSFRIIAFFVLSVSLYSSFANGDDDLVELSKKVMPSVVHLTANKKTGVATGSGFIVGPNLIITNAHVVQGCSKLDVKFDGGTIIASEGLRYIDYQKDIAVVSVDAATSLMKSISLCEEYPSQGEDVAAFGSPQGLQFSVTKGVVSGVRTSEEVNETAGTWIQTDAAVSPGNSGGPLVNYSAQVVGMNTFVRNESQNLNFSISSLDIKAALDKAKNSDTKKFEDVEYPDDKANYSHTREWDIASIRERLVEILERAIPDLTTKDLRELGIGNLNAAFKPIPPNAVKTGEIARIQGLGTLVQVLETGCLVMFGETKFFVYSPTFNGPEYRAKFGDDVVFNIPVDEVVYVGPAAPYETRGGDTSYLIAIYAVREVLSSDDLKKIVETEEKKREDARKASRLRSYARKLLRRFESKNGKYEVEAYAIGLDQTTVELLKLNDLKRISVQRTDLCQQDNDWITDNADLIKEKGETVLNLILSGPEKSK